MHEADSGTGLNIPRCHQTIAPVRLCTKAKEPSSPSHRRLAPQSWVLRKASRRRTTSEPRGDLNRAVHVSARPQIISPKPVKLVLPPASYERSAKTAQNRKEQPFPKLLALNQFANFEDAGKSSQC